MSRANQPSYAVADRRAFLRSAASAAALALCARMTYAAATEPRTNDAADSNEEAEVTPGEDLMQEHGVLERILLIYDESARRIDGGESLDLTVVTDAAGIIRRFVEDYHERLEEDFVFPRLEKAKRETDLVAVLRLQHRRGREVTEELVRVSSAGKASPALARLLLGFERMYRPHAAREETVLFPAFRQVVGRAAYRELGEQFEEQEHERFGAHGFEGTVAAVADLERKLGIEDLSRFTQSAA